MSGRRITVILVGVNTPGYRSLALDYLQATALTDPRLDIALQRFDVGTDTDPWWTAYRILALDPEPGVVAMPVLCWTAEHVHTVARLVKQASPRTLVVLGGPEVGPLAEEVLAEHSAIDAVVRGEGEFAFCDLLHSHARDGDISGVPGVTAREGTRIVSAPERSAIEHLDEIPSPYMTGLPVVTDGSAYIETYRGCPHRCAYCYEGKGSTRIRSFSWERIAADIDAVASSPGIQAFSFIDPVFNLTPDRLQRLAGLMEPYVAHGVRLHTIEVDIERIDDVQAALLKSAGVVSVETGPQTIGMAALDACARGFDADRFLSGVEACKRAGIGVECDLIVGLPGDTTKDVLSSIDFAIGLDPGRVQMSTLHVLPGTVLWERAEELGLKFDRQPPHEIISTPDMPFTELRRLEVFGNAAVTAYRAKLTTSTAITTT